jgi:starch phosphorylase
MLPTASTCPPGSNRKSSLLLDKYLGADWLDKHDDPAIWQLLDNVPDAELWQTHHWLKVKLIDAIRERTRLRWADGGGSTSVMLAGGAFLDPSVLTLGLPAGSPRTKERC